MANSLAEYTNSALIMAASIERSVNEFRCREEQFQYPDGKELERCPTPGQSITHLVRISCFYARTFILQHFVREGNNFEVGTVSLNREAST